MAHLLNTKKTCDWLIAVSKNHLKTDRQIWQKGSTITRHENSKSNHKGYNQQEHLLFLQPKIEQTQSIQKLLEPMVFQLKHEHTHCHCASHFWRQMYQTESPWPHLLTQKKAENTGNLLIINKEMHNKQSVSTFLCRMRLMTCNDSIKQELVVMLGPMSKAITIASCKFRTHRNY